MDPGWDAAIAGVIEWRLWQKNAPLPDWLAEFGLRAPEGWEPIPAPYRISPDSVPAPLRWRGVWIDAAELESA